MHELVTESNECSFGQYLGEQISQVVLGRYMNHIENVAVPKSFDPVLTSVNVLES